MKELIAQIRIDENLEPETKKKIKNIKSFLVSNRKDFEAGKKTLEQFATENILGYKKILDALRKDEAIKHNRAFSNSQLSVADLIKKELIL